MSLLKDCCECEIIVNFDYEFGQTIFSKSDFQITVHNVKYQHGYVNVQKDIIWKDANFGLYDSQRDFSNCNSLHESTDTVKIFTLTDNTYCGIYCKKPFMTDSTNVWKFELVLSNKKSKEHYSVVLELNSSYTKDEGYGLVDIMDSFKLLVPIKLKYHYLVVYPIKDYASILSIRRGPIWSSKFPIYDETLLVGHRGFGATPEVFQPGNISNTAYPENTIKCFKQAAKLGLDFAELDVLWTQDQRLIIYHDFHAACSETQLLHNMPLDEVNKTRLPCSDEEADLYPLFENVLKNVPNTLGLNVEIKYPCLQENGLWCTGSSSNVPEEYFVTKNNYIDAVIKEIIEFAGQRKIVLSSFNPDVCWMLHRKQDQFPVFQITRGTQEYHEKRHVDLRISSLEGAIAWASSTGLDGVVTNAQQWSTNPHLITVCQEQDLVTMAYGSGVGTVEYAEFACKYELNGLILDDVEGSVLFQQRQRLKSD